MQPSPIQLKDLTYTGFNVWHRTLNEEERQSAPLFDFDGVMIGEAIEVVDLTADDTPSFAVKLRIVIANEEGKLAPYKLDIEVFGIFGVNTSVAREDRAELIEVNGCAILYGAIRDLVLNLTCRSINGAMILPTVNFLDRRKKKGSA